MTGLLYILKKNGVWPQPVLRFVAIALFYYFGQCRRQLPYIYMTFEKSKSLTEL